MRRSGLLWWPALALVVLGAGFLLGPGRTSGPPLDPTSTDPLGTRALVELVEGFGADVDRTSTGEGPGDEVDAVLVLRDQLGDEGRDRLEAWARQGGVLVVADPSSPLNRPPVATSSEPALEAGTCTIAPLAGLQRVEAGSFLLLPVEAGERSCFGTAGEAWVVARSAGAGAVVLIGGTAPLVNENLDEADNAAVVTALLSPEPGDQVGLVYDAVAGEGGSVTLADLVPDRVWWALAQLGVAFAVYVSWRARRFGRPVPEAQPVDLPGSLLVRARGELYRRSRSHERVAVALQRDADRRVRRLLGLPLEGPLPVPEVAARSGLPDDEVRRLLVQPPAVARTRDATRLAQQLDDLVERLTPETADRRGAAL